MPDLTELNRRHALAFIAGAFLSPHAPLRQNQIDFVLEHAGKPLYDFRGKMTDERWDIIMLMRRIRYIRRSKPVTDRLSF